MVDQVKASYYPQIGLNAEYTQTNNPMYSFGNILNQRQFDQSIDFNNPGRTDDLNLRAGLQYRLYNGGRDQAGIKAAEAGVAVSEMQQVTVSSQLGFEVVRTFYTIAQAMDMLEAHQASIKAIETSLFVARARFEAGDLLKADLLNIEVQESMAKENLIIAEHSLELARKAFLGLLGLREGQVFINTIQESEQELPEDRSYGKRPELKGLEGQIEAAEAELRIAEGGRYPTVDGLAHYQYDGGVVLHGSGDSWMGGVRVNYPLFTGGKTEADIANARAKVARLAAEKQKLELTMDLEIKQADHAYKQAEQRLQVTEKMFEQALESARLSRIRFKEGVVLASDLMNIETRLTEAQVRQTAAKAAIRVAVADLRRATGLPQF
jgi:outer membrane protein TolC